MARTAARRRASGDEFDILEWKAGVAEAGDQAIADAVRGGRLKRDLRHRLVHVRGVGAPASHDIDRGDAAAIDRPHLVDAAIVVDQQRTRQSHLVALRGIAAACQRVDVGELAPERRDPLGRPAAFDMIGQRQHFGRAGRHPDVAAKRTSGAAGDRLGRRRQRVDPVDRLVDPGKGLAHHVDQPPQAAPSVERLLGRAPLRLRRVGDHVRGLPPTLVVRPCHGARMSRGAGPVERPRNRTDRFTNAPTLC